MGKVQECDRQKLINDLKALYKENTWYLVKMENGKTDTKHSKKTIDEFRKVLYNLKNYIQDIENGLEMYRDFGDWCDMCVDALLDDDNFWTEEDGFSWH